SPGLQSRLRGANTGRGSAACPAQPENLCPAGGRGRESAAGGDGPRARKPDPEDRSLAGPAAATTVPEDPPLGTGSRPLQGRGDVLRRSAVAGAATARARGGAAFGRRGVSARRRGRLLSPDRGVAGRQRGSGDRTVPAGPRQTGTGSARIARGSQAAASARGGASGRQVEIWSDRYFLCGDTEEE